MEIAEHKQSHDLLTRMQDRLAAAAVEGVSFKKNALLTDSSLMKAVACHSHRGFSSFRLSRLHALSLRLFVWNQSAPTHSIETHWIETRYLCVVLNFHSRADGDDMRLLSSYKGICFTHTWSIHYYWHSILVFIAIVCSFIGVSFTYHWHPGQLHKNCKACRF